MCAHSLLFSEKEIIVIRRYVKGNDATFVSLPENEIWVEE